MKITMNTTAQGPGVNYLAGVTYEVGGDGGVPPATAKAFIDGGYARKVERERPVEQPTEPAPAVETADAKPAVETAVAAAPAPGKKVVAKGKKK